MLGWKIHRLLDCTCISFCLLSGWRWLMLVLMEILRKMDFVEIGCCRSCRFLICWMMVGSCINNICKDYRVNVSVIFIFLSIFILFSSINCFWNKLNKFHQHVRNNIIWTSWQNRHRHPSAIMIQIALLLLGKQLKQSTIMIYY